MEKEGLRFKWLRFKRVCPLCKGEGYITKPKKTLIEAKKIMAKSLRKEGYSIREIQRLLGYKSPKSIQDMLTNKKTAKQRRSKT